MEFKEKRIIKKGYTDKNGNYKEYGIEYTKNGEKETYKETGEVPEELKGLDIAERAKIMSGMERFSIRGIIEEMFSGFSNVFGKLPFERRPRLPHTEGFERGYEDKPVTYDVKPYDIQKDNGDIFITVEVPGMTKDDLHLTKESNRLRVKSKETARKNVDLSINIPHPIDKTSPIEAKVTNGILEIKLKCLESREEDIEIN